MSQRILFVDDSRELLQAYTDLFEDEGYAVAVAESGTAALEAIRRQRPDLIVTDIFMPGMDGLELIQRVRSELPPPAIPVIAASGMPNVRDEAIRRGAVAFALKPIDVDQILTLVRDALAGGRHEGAVADLAITERRLATRELAEGAVEHYLHTASDPTHEVFRALRVVSRFFGHSTAQLLWSRGGDIVLGGSSETTKTTSTALQKVLADAARGVIENIGSVVATSLDGRSVLEDVFHSDLRFLACVPVKLGPLPVGALALIDQQPHRFSASELRLLELAGSRAAVLFADPLNPGSLDPSGLVAKDGFLRALGEIMLLAGEEQTPLGVAVARFHQPYDVRRANALALNLPPRTLAGNLGRRVAAVFTSADSLSETRHRLVQVRSDAAQLGVIDAWGQLILEQPLPPLTAAALLDWCSGVSSRRGGQLPTATGLELIEDPQSLRPDSAGDQGQAPGGDVRDDGRRSAS